jgi:hypothetical protein
MTHGYGHQCTKNAKLIKLDSSYFLETTQKSLFALRMKELLRIERDKQARFDGSNVRLKTSNFTTRMQAELLNCKIVDLQGLPLPSEVAGTVNRGLTYLKDIYFLNEYFTLFLLTSKNRKFMSPSTGYSFKSNLIMSHKKSLYLEKNLEEILLASSQEEDLLFAQPLKLYLKLVKVLHEINSFVNNLKYFLNMQFVLAD